MKRKTIALFCAVIFACSGAVSTYATTSECQTTTEQGPRDSRTVKEPNNRPKSTPRTPSAEKKSERKSPRTNESNSSSNSKSSAGSQSRFNSNPNNNWKSR